MDCLRRIRRHGAGQEASEEVDKERIKELYTEGGVRLRRPPQARILGIDEFSLRKGHQYAVVIMDLETVYGFSDFSGDDWMDNAETVAFDRERLPGGLGGEMLSYSGHVRPFPHRPALQQEGRGQG